jgi:serine/threonine-protein kinase ATR
LLQLLLEKEYLWSSTLDAWIVFIKTVNVTEIAELLRQITVNLMQIHSRCTQFDLRKLTKIFEFIICDRGAILAAKISQLPEIPSGEIWNKTRVAVKQYSSNLNGSIESNLESIYQLLLHDNPKLIQQGLTRYSNFLLISRLKTYLYGHQVEVQNLILGEEVAVAVKKLIIALLDIVARYNEDPTICIVALDCFGIIGAIDPSRMDLIEISQEGTNYALNSQEECLDFCCFLIQDHLVPSFRAAHDSSSQSSLSFTIQDILKFCGFTIELIQASEELGNIRKKVKTDIRKTLIEKWKAFPPSYLSTLTPLITSRYYIEPFKAAASCEYPIFNSSSNYQDWIRKWCLDLGARAANPTSARIFSSCSNLIAKGDISTAILLLPYYTCNALNGDPQYANELQKEFCYVLTVNVEGNENTETARLCLQIIFRLLDHISKRLSFCRNRVARLRGRSGGLSPQALSYETEAKSLDSFLKGIPQSLIAKAAMEAKAFARALMHFEQHFRYERQSKGRQELQSHYSELQNIYGHLRDIDSLEGVSSKLDQQSLSQQIVVHQVCGDWASAQSCFELLLQSEPTNREYQFGLLDSLSNLGHYEALILQAKGIEKENTLLDARLDSAIIGSCWKAEKWDILSKYLKKEYEPTFDCYVAILIHHMRSKEYDSFANVLREAKATLIAPIAAAGMDSYARAYENIVKLSQLNDLEHFYNAILLTNLPGTFELSMRQWDDLSKLRLQAMDIKNRQPSLTLRRILTVLTKELYAEYSSFIDEEIGKLWLLSAKDYRKMCHFQTAYSSILHAMRFDAKEAPLQKAKLLWDQSQTHQAMSYLQLLTDRTDTVPKGLDPRKEKLLLASWKDKTSHSISSSLIVSLTNFTKEYPEWEKAQFMLGRYYNRLYEYERNLKRDEDEGSIGKYSLSMATTVGLICRQYAKTLILGCKYLYEAMPRLLSLWLDLGLKVCDPASCLTSDLEKIKEKMDQVNVYIRKCLKSLPTFQFLSAISQLTSRISHPNQTVQIILDQILGSVLVQYPQQTLWHIIPVLKSSDQLRKSRASSVISKAKAASNRSNPELSSRIECANSMIDCFIQLCSCPVAKDTVKLSMSKDFATLYRLAQTPFNMILPLQSSLTIALPTGKSSESNHKAFPDILPVITGFKDTIDVMHSLQRPRRITISGSDGKEYIFLCKPDDDLRKDTRVMELNGIVNKLLKKNEESRVRKLKIRTYAVIPLSEKCGIIQWVSNMNAFRGILLKQYKERNMILQVGCYLFNCKHSEIKELLSKYPPVEAYTDYIYPRYPPIFHTWFLDTFPEPAKWLSARKAYTATVAVMSMVGYVVGLGDRHGENILLDELTGEILHVDLNCLFEKGKDFEIPERVPFRLTRNIADAFGVLGIEGGFLKSCQITLGLLRSNRELLMSVLETFLHDPLCEWSKKIGKSVAMGGNWASKATAVKILSTISRKLEGFVDLSKMPVNVVGQVDALVADASNIDNLAKMYIGWAAYL